MGLTNFTDDDDDTTPSGPGGLPPGVLINGATPGQTGTSDIADLLIDYNAKFKSADPTLFRDTLIEQTLATLIGKNKPNVLLKGSAGVGKTRIVEDIARRIAVGDTLIPDLLAGHTIYELPVASIVAGSGFMGQLEEKAQAVVDFISDKKNKAILFIDEIHQITGGSSSHGDSTYRKLSQIFKPALARGQMRVIGATTSTESRAFDEDPAFSRRFSQLIVDELTVEQSREVLTTVRTELMAHYRHQITVTDQVLDDVTTIAETHSRAGQHRPDSAITLLDRAMASRILDQKRLIALAERDGDTTLANTLRSTPAVPLSPTRVLNVAKALMTGNAQRHDLDMEALQTCLHELKGQGDVLDTLVNQLTRNELEVFPRTTPEAWLFAGASGVGKTKAVKIISEQMTGSDPIILNMAEYHTPSDTAKIIGAPPGYVGSDSMAELPFDTLESNPHRVVLLDEFEKADKAVQRLFLSAFDEGYLRNAHGTSLDFSKALVICTTNAARDALSASRLGFGERSSKLSHQSLTKELSQFFDTELLGRFSLVVGFNSIDARIFRDVMTAFYLRERARILDLKPRYANALPDMIPDEELDRLARVSYVESQGARPAEKAVRTWIEDQLLVLHTQMAAAPTYTTHAADTSDTSTATS